MRATCAAQGVSLYMRANRSTPRVLLACVLSLAGSAFAQPVARAQTKAPQNAPLAIHLPAGTTLCAALEKTVDAKKAKVGDAVAAKTTMAVLAHGSVAITSGTRILGHVTSARAHSKSHAGSELGLSFDRIELKGGGEAVIETLVQAIGYGGLPRLDEDENGNGAYSGAAASAAQAASGASRHSGFPPPRPEPADTPTAQRPGTPPRTPALDAGSKGVVGIDGLTLTEGNDAARGSVVTTKKKNVKLERGTQLILRVVGQAPDSAKDN